MARKHQPAAAEALEELESAADRLAEWIRENLWVVFGSIAALLAIAAIGSWIATANRRAEEDASAGLAKVRDDYLSAMGVGPGALEVPELANPEAAAQIQAEYQERFGEVADDHPGLIAGTVARLESVRLASDAGRSAEALALAEQALEEAPSDPAVRGMVLQRLAQRLESEGRWSDAAAQHEAASKVSGYPLGAWALVDAARCYAQAGDIDRAVALYERLDVDHPDLRLPDHLRVQSRELRAAGRD